MIKFKQFKLPIHTDDRFSLIEAGKDLGFTIKRVYVIVDGVKPSGSHCHKVEEECFFVARGSAVMVIDDGSGLRDVNLNQGEAVYVGAYVWHHFKSFALGTVVVALSSTDYDSTRQDYISDYEEFRKVNNK